MKCALLAAVGGVLLTAQAQPPKGLQVLSATLNTTTHRVTVQLHNATDKPVVAYVLNTEGFDARGNKVGEVQQVFDYIGPEPNPDRVHFIQPKGDGTVDYTRPEPPDPRILKLAPEHAAEFEEAVKRAAAWDATVSVRVSVEEIVYEDRTCEGSYCATPSGDIFHGRRVTVITIRELLKTDLKDYPDTPEKKRNLIDTLGLLRFHPPKEILTREHWESIRAEMVRNGEWWEIQSKPQGATK